MLLGFGLKQLLFIFIFNYFVTALQLLSVFQVSVVAVNTF